MDPLISYMTLDNLVKQKMGGSFNENDVSLKMYFKNLLEFT